VNIRRDIRMKAPIIIPVQSGGKLLGQGYYGCVFDPPLTCRGEKNPKAAKKGQLGKLTEIDDVEAELMAAKFFKDKPEAKKYFILADLKTLCKPSDSGEPAIDLTKQTEKDLDKCAALEREGIDDMVHYQMEYGGKSLHERFHVVQASFPFYKFMGHMLEVGAYLALNGIIHNDLHSGNIVVNKDSHPRLIDFGRAYNSKDINMSLIEKLAADYYPDLGQITPECSTLDGLSQNVQFPRIIQDLIQKKPGLLYAERLFGQGRQEQMAEFQQFWKTSKSLQKNDVISFWKLYWPVVDAWSIGHCLAGTIYKLKQSTRFMDSEEWKKKFGVVKAIITGLLKASPRARLDSVEALALYDPMNSLVLSASGKAWLKHKQSQREKLSAGV
jgi:serine/threonine protein kinase